MSSKSNELIAGLFSDSENIQILCSIYGRVSCLDGGCG